MCTRESGRRDTYVYVHIYVYVFHAHIQISRAAPRAAVRIDLYGAPRISGVRAAADLGIVSSAAEFTLMLFLPVR